MTDNDPNQSPGPEKEAPQPAKRPAPSPRDLLAGGLDSTVPAGNALAWDPPPIEDLAQHFPRFEISGLLGRGGMGAVYRARQRELDRDVAIKILPPKVGADPAFAERFAREARAMASLGHPNIVTIHDFGQADGMFFLIMEFIDGVNLREAIRSHQVDPQKSLGIVGQVCDALQYAHEEGVVHRDIKPENILLDKRGRVKIADFGLAKLLGVDEPEISLTLSHQAIGTPRYMAPEQVTGSSSVDHRADIYSLGVVFYELLTGETPMGRFEAPSKRVAVDVRLDEVVLRTLEREPDRRYQQVSQVKTDMDAISVSGSSPAVAPDSQPGTEGGEARSGSPVGAVAEASPVVAVPIKTRFSKSAIVGALLVPFFFVMLVGFFTLTAGRGPGLEPRGVNWVALLASIFVGIPGAVAPVGTTVLGLVAITRIRRSEGRIVGLPLAVADALFFPLLFLDVLILVVTFAIARQIENSMGPDFHLGILIPIAAGIVISVVVDFLLARAAWRAARKPING